MEPLATMDCIHSKETIAKTTAAAAAIREKENQQFSKERWMEEE